MRERESEVSSVWEYLVRMEIVFESLLRIRSKCGKSSNELWKIWLVFLKLRPGLNRINNYVLILHIESLSNPSGRYP